MIYTLSLTAMASWRIVSFLSLSRDHRGSKKKGKEKAIVNVAFLKTHLLFNQFCILKLFFTIKPLHLLRKIIYKQNLQIPNLLFFWFIWTV
jgi:hypothetical protein